MSTTTANKEDTFDLEGATIILLKDEKMREGRGGENVRVYKGFFNGTTPIAIKVYKTKDEKIKEQAQKDFLFLSSPDKRHEHIIRYFGKVEMKSHL